MADRVPKAGMPLWVKVAGIIALILIGLFVVLMLIGGHGPGAHGG